MRTQHILLILLFWTLVTLLMSCSANVGNGQVQLEPSPVAIQSGIQAFGTLASSGTYEMELAPTYTRLAKLRYNAASLLEQDRIPLQTAVDIQDGADLIRISLDQARLAGEKKDMATVTRLNDQAKQMLDKFEGKLS